MGKFKKKSFSKWKIARYVAPFSATCLADPGALVEAAPCDDCAYPTDRYSSPTLGCLKFGGAPLENGLDVAFVNPFQ